VSADGIVFSKQFLPFLDNDSQRTMLLYYGLICNDDGLFWPSTADISIETGKSERAIRRTNKELENYWLLAINPSWRNDGSQKSNYYQLLLKMTPKEFLKRRRSGSRIMSTSRKRVEHRLDAYCNLLECWAQTLSCLKDQLNPQVFHTWFARLSVRSLKRKTLSLGVPNENFKQYHEANKSSRLLLKIGSEFFGNQLSFIYFRTKSEEEK
jgi:DnaA N-terminal domain